MASARRFYKERKPQDELDNFIEAHPSADKSRALSLKVNCINALESAETGQTAMPPALSPRRPRAYHQMELRQRLAAMQAGNEPEGFEVMTGSPEQLKRALADNDFWLKLDDPAPDATLTSAAKKRISPMARAFVKCGFSEREANHIVALICEVAQERAGIHKQANMHGI